MNIWDNISGTGDIIIHDDGAPASFLKQQITINIINEDLEALEKDVDVACDSLNELGIVLVREDVALEQCFWSQLPANFTFMARQQPIHLSHSMSLASLHSFPTGNKQGSAWGEPLSVFKTVMNTPYFFNLHNDQAGHLLIVSPRGYGKTVLLNFLIAQSRKFQTSIYYFDYEKASQIFVQALGGQYHDISFEGDEAAQNHFQMNPIERLMDGRMDKEFITGWLKSLVSYGSKPPKKEELDHIDEIIDEILANKSKEKLSLSQIAKYFNKPRTKYIANRLKNWYGDGKYSRLFDNKEASKLEGPIHGFDLTEVVNNKFLTGIVTSYLINRIEISLDESHPNIIIFDEAWKFLDNKIMGPRIKKMLERFNKKNTTIIFATESPKAMQESKITDVIAHNISTRIFFPNPQANDYYKKVFGITADELKLLKNMVAKDRYFLLKQDNDTVIASINLAEVPEIVAALSSVPSNQEVADQCIAEYGNNPEDWLPYFLQAMLDKYS